MESRSAARRAALLVGVVALLALAACIPPTDPPGGGTSSTTTTTTEPPLPAPPESPMVLVPPSAGPDAAAVVWYDGPEDGPEWGFYLSDADTARLLDPEDPDDRAIIDRVLGHLDPATGRRLERAFDGLDGFLLFHDEDGVTSEVPGTRDADGPATFSFSPDGSKFVTTRSESYLNETTIYDTETLTPIVSTSLRPAGLNVWFPRHVWSPDSTRLALLANGGTVATLEAVESALPRAVVLGDQSETPAWAETVFGWTEADHLLYLWWDSSNGGFYDPRIELREVHSSGVEAPRTLTSDGYGATSTWTGGGTVLLPGGGMVASRGWSVLDEATEEHFTVIAPHLMTDGDAETFHPLSIPVVGQRDDLPFGSSLYVLGFVPRS